jgi:adenosine deaminase CECR1
MRKLLLQLHEDGVKWVDLRLAFTFRYFKEGQEVPENTFAEMFRVLDDEIEKFKGSEEGKGFWGARMIWTGIRALDTRKIIEDMDACITIKVRQLLHNSLLGSET